MNKVELLRQLTNEARNNNEDFNKAYEYAMKKIANQASGGKNEICTYDIFAYDTDYNIRQMVKDKLQQEGFVLTKGMYMGKGMGNWETPYVVW